MSQQVCTAFRVNLAGGSRVAWKPPYYFNIFFGVGWDKVGMGTARGAVVEWSWGKNLKDIVDRGILNEARSGGGDLRVRISGRGCRRNFARGLSGRGGLGDLGSGVSRGSRRGIPVVSDNP